MTARHCQARTSGGAIVDFCGCAVHYGGYPAFCFTVGGTNCSDGLQSDDFPDGSSYKLCNASVPPSPPGEPPSPPLPPFEPGSCLCTNECLLVEERNCTDIWDADGGHVREDCVHIPYPEWAGDGFCDDGRPGSFDDSCRPGTDCDDCGHACDLSHSRHHLPPHRESHPFLPLLFHLILHYRRLHHQ